MLTETENKDEPILPSKRKLEQLPISEDKEEETLSNKSQKLPSLTHGDTVVPNKENTTHSINSGSNSPIAEGKCEAEKNVIGVADEEEEEEDDADFEDEEKENGKAASADRKGKGIMIEEEYDDSDDDNSESESDSSDDSIDGLDSDCDELEDDPLAEVDLDNILPSRTRRRVAQPGVRIANDLGNKVTDDK